VGHQGRTTQPARARAEERTLLPAWDWPSGSDHPAEGAISLSGGIKARASSSNVEPTKHPVGGWAGT
jgi:hypothetical protein